MEIPVGKKILAANDQVAERLRRRFKADGITVMNMLSSPGAGKTSLLEKFLEMDNVKLPVAVIEGDLETDADAQRLKRFGIPVHQIVTGTSCHLEAPMIEKALENLLLEGIRFLVIENVGNLVCPASYDLGEDLRTVVVSVTEGEDKPLKYPPVFSHASAVLINKIDLLPYLRFDIDFLRDSIRKMAPQARIFETSCFTGEGIVSWADWIMERIGGS